MATDIKETHMQSGSENYWFFYAGVTALFRLHAQITFGKKSPKMHPSGTSNCRRSQGREIQQPRE